MISFGLYLRGRREALRLSDRGYSVRQVAKRVGLESAYLGNPADGGGLLGALSGIRDAGPVPLLVMQFAARDTQYRRFYDGAAEASRQRTAERLSGWLECEPGSHPMWNAIVVQIADFSLNGFMRWLESGKPDMDSLFASWMVASRFISGSAYDHGRCKDVA